MHAMYQCTNVCNKLGRQKAKGVGRHSRCAGAMRVFRPQGRQNVAHELVLDPGRLCRRCERYCLRRSVAADLLLTLLPPLPATAERLLLLLTRWGLLPAHCIR